MADRHLFVMDPLEGVDPHHDTTYVLMREAQNRDVEVWCCRSVHLHHRNQELVSRARRVTISEDNEGNQSHFEQEASRQQLLVDEFDLVWMREDPPFDQRYLHATYLLDESPAPVINNPAGIRNTNEKLSILNVPELIPETWVGADPDEAVSFLEQVGRGVAKSLSGYGGEDVHRVKANDPASREQLEAMTDGGETPVMVQVFLPAVLEDGDRRLILLGGEPIGGLTRHPQEGDFRANLHSGGRAADVYVTDRERDICEQLKPFLLDRGLHLVGLDLIDNKITEINVTSPTCVQEINRNGDGNELLEERILDYAESAILSGNTPA